MAQKYSLTEEHRAQLKPWAERWIANAMSCDPMTEEERDRTYTAILGLYSAAKLDPPRRVVFCASPISAGIAAGIAAGVWYLRDNPAKQREFFGRSIPESELIAAIAPTCAWAARIGQERLRTLKQQEPILRSAAATYAATYDATAAATRAATRDATYAATYAATAAATRAATADAMDLVSFLVQCTGFSWRMRNGGNQWAAWCSYLSFFRHVAQLQIDYSKWEHYETAALCSGPRYMHARFCIVSDRPERIRIDDECRPHCADGPSHRWRDGWELFHWRGVRVPADWILKPHELEPVVAINWPDIEQRRAAAEIVGWTRILKQLDAKVVDKDRNPQIGTLLRADLPDSPGQQFLRVQCGTGREFVLPMPPDVKTAREANAWSFGLEPHELRLEVRT